MRPNKVSLAGLTMPGLRKSRRPAFLSPVAEAPRPLQTSRRGLVVLLAVIAASLVAGSPAAFANGVPLTNGDVLAAVGNGQVKHFSSTGSLLDTLDTGTGATYTTGMCFDANHNLFVTDFDSDISEFNATGNLVNGTWVSSYPSSVESCTFNASGDMFVGGPSQSTIYEYSPAGSVLNTFSVATDPSGTSGTDWLDLESDQCTLLYTDEGSLVKSYNVCTATQNADFASGLPAPCFELRVRPSGEVIVACGSEAVRLNSSGGVIQDYPVTGSSELFAMNLDPDGTTFWTGDIANGEISHVDIATGSILSQFSSSPNTSLAGLSIVGGIVVSVPQLTLAPPTQNQTVGSNASVTATLDINGTPTSGKSILFSVTGANTASGSGTTNTSGQAAFSYKGTSTGADLVTACYDANNNGVCDAGEATATASVSWTAGTAPTTLTTSLSGGGSKGATITVPPGTSVTDSATLTGANVATAGGTVTYSVFSDAACKVSAGSPSTVNVTGGAVPNSNPVTLSTPGTYYWVASYSGDSTNGASASSCGSETETVTAPGKPPVVDDSSNQTGSTSITDTQLTTSSPNDLVVAYVSADGPASGGQSVTVSGSGLAWTRVAQQNGVLGDAEVWAANAGTNKKITVKVTAAKKGYGLVLTDVTYKNATGIGAKGTFKSTSGAPTGTITTTQSNSWVWAVGFDWATATKRTVGPSQTLFSQNLDAANNTYWVQSTKSPTLAAGTNVTINDTAPTTDPYDLVLVEIL